MNLDDLTVFKKWLYTPHVAKWYHDPQDWINEVEKQDSDFNWIYHFIVENDGTPIGFCQYYACKDSDELWEGYTALGGSYSIDYMIGETDYLRKGFGKKIVADLTNRIMLHNDAKRIVVHCGTAVLRKSKPPFSVSRRDYSNLIKTSSTLRLNPR